MSKGTSTTEERKKAFAEKEKLHQEKIAKDKSIETESLSIEKNKEIEIEEPVKETIKEIKTEGRGLDKKAEEYNPYQGNVEDKGYNTADPTIIGGGTGDIKIPEAVTEQPTININEAIHGKDLEQEEKEQGGDKPYKEKEKRQPVNVDFGKPEEDNKPEPLNPAMKGLRKKDLKNAAERGADMIFFLYEALQTLGYRWLNLEDEKIQKKAMSGDFDMESLNVPIPLGSNQYITAGQFLQSYNRELRRTLNYNPQTGKCELTEEFVEEVRADLIEVLTAKGIGVTPLQNVLFIFGMDIYEKASRLTGLKVQANTILKGINETLHNQRVILNNQKNNTRQSNANYNTPPPERQPDNSSRFQTQSDVDKLNNSKDL